MPEQRFWRPALGSPVSRQPYCRTARRKNSRKSFSAPAATIEPSNRDSPGEVDVNPCALRRNFLPFLGSPRQTNRDRLLPAGHLLSAPAALQRALLSLEHRMLDILRCALRFLRHCWYAVL